MKISKCAAFVALVLVLTGCSTVAISPSLTPQGIEVRLGGEAGDVSAEQLQISPTREERIHEEWHRYYRKHGVPPKVLYENDHGLIFPPPAPEAI